MSLKLALILHPLDTKRGLTPQVGLHCPFAHALHSISSSASDAAYKKLCAVSLIEHDLNTIGCSNVFYINMFRLAAKVALRVTQLPF